MAGFIPRDDEEIILIDEEEPVTKKETRRETKKGTNFNPRIPKHENETEDTIIVEEEPVKEKTNEIIDEEESKNFIQGLLGYITNPGFEKRIVEQAQNNGLEPRQIANGFATKVLGTISDLFHLALDTIADAFATLVSVLAGVLIKGGELLIRVAKRLVRIVTLNKTAK